MSELITLTRRQARRSSVKQPTKFEFIVSVKAVEQIGLAIPPNVLARADRVIKMIEKNEAAILGLN